MWRSRPSAALLQGVGTYSAVRCIWPATLAVVLRGCSFKGTVAGLASETREEGETETQLYPVGTVPNHKHTGSTFALPLPGLDCSVRVQVAHWREHLTSATGSTGAV